MPARPFTLSPELPPRRVETELHALLAARPVNQLTIRSLNWSTAALSEHRGFTASTSALLIFSAPTPIFIFSKNPLS